ncbi:hypothetical protein LEP1GSC016_0656 [Leptospira borgpetersenii serovar Hardjo-bovis str. Sponselee]|uniref:Uncharacterized protein n=7 Tax=Leptospira borgpetersenii TaxID=174 RepID=M3F7C1_LEPBO|nr:hypothetical protein LBBP_02052 [Leptospira borgpetersenii serovar Ballum]EKP14133.1 hypothetical protein LEP1GSC128_2912 [Leptospira borgpetersenii str. 200801926]EKQ90753.1 hypothetical protein LEP1GSC101_0605 [Leptospira borgpetersenii str. UI 09149]EKR00220.1 hypothetical protein LEP1GSC121_3847 [Leptospira borgpetersenii serovar Castellonis str. 200801910]EMF97857.1 hypothetical protein LEP1GSC123_4219 [Leptospira borgpetersenii str. 200701203]EMJ77149.1 hypothetical protein LEP1GSC016
MLPVESGFKHDFPYCHDLKIKKRSETFSGKSKVFFEIIP